MKVNKPTGIMNPYRLQNQAYSTQQKKDATFKKDYVQISEQAKALLETKTTDPARLQKVEQLKEQVQNGSYQVDPRKVAEKVYDFWFDH